MLANAADWATIGVAESPVSLVCRFS